MTVWFKRAISALAFVLPVSAFAQNIYVYPAAPTAPRGSYQTVTAIVNGVNNKTVTWSSDGGTIVGTNPCVVNEPCTVALYTPSTGTYHLTATSNANHAVTASSTITVTGSPSPVTGHPRLILTPSMLSGIQAKATSSNPVYQSIRNRAISVYNSNNSIWSWSCNGGSGLPSSAQDGGKENDAYVFAFMSLVDPGDPTYKWGCYGRDIWTYVMGEVVNGREFFGGNQWSDGVLPFTMTTDWLMGGGYLSAADQTLARKFLYVAAQKSLFNNGYIPPTSGYNSAAQFNTGNAYELVSMRAMGNNYTMSRVLYMLAFGLTFNDDTVDDPPLANTCSATRYQICPDGTAGSLHAYFRYAVGSMLYLDWAHLEDPDVSWQAYQATYSNLPSRPSCVYVDGSKHPCFGDGRGGESAEGSWYQYSMYRLRYALNLLHTAGYDDPIAYGPQISLATSSWWDLKYVSDIEFLTGASTQTSSRPAAYNYLTTGDSNWYSRSLGDLSAEASMLTADSYSGRTDRTSALKWLLLNIPNGGPLGTNGNCSGLCGFDATIGTEGAGWPAAPVAFDWLISQPASDPVSSLPPDPRPSLPTELYNGSFNQHVMLRNSWTTNPTLFSAYCPNSMIDHDHQYCGRFDIFANGEYITKGRTEFTDYNDVMTSASQSNIAAYLNTGGSGCNDPQCTLGGQFYRAIQSGMNTFYHSELPGYAALIADTTNDYNGVWMWSAPYDIPGYNDITAASRSLVYLRDSNRVVFYDRGASNRSADKAVYQITTGKPTISGNAASWPTRSNSQIAYMTALLPANAAPSIAPLPIYTTTSAPYSNLQNGTTMQATCSNVNADGSTTDCTPTAIWESDNSAIASVSSTGVVTAHGLGSTGIHASASGFGTTAIVNVVSGTSSGSWSVDHDNRQIEDWEPASSIKVDAGSVSSAQFLNVLEFGPSSLTRTTPVLVQSTSGQGFDGAKIGSTAVMFMRTWPGTFSGTTYPASGATAHYVSDLSPNTTYSISAAGAPASATTDTAGVLVFSASGTGSVTIGSGSGSTSATLQSISVSPGTISLTASQTQQFVATCYYSDTTNQVCSSQVAWSSNNPTALTVNASGLATALTQGGATVSAALSGIQGSATVNVGAPALQSITVTPGSSTVSVGATQQFKATGVFSDSSTADLTTSVSWKSSNSTVAAPNSTGLTAALASGSANIMASSGTVQGQGTVIVSTTSTPTFSPGGGTYTSAQSVTITASTPSATIYYTTDGSTPTTASRVYGGPINVPSTETVEAIAVASGSASTVAVATYTITLPNAATPGFTPNGGTYSTAQLVTISTSTPSAAIYYTTDGSVPTTNSALYTGPVTVSASKTLSAIAVASSYSNSTVGSASYVIQATVATPTFSPAPGRYVGPQTVSISTTTASATIHYTNDGTVATASSPVYAGPITVSSSSTLNAIAIANGAQSANVSGSYTITVPTAAAPAFTPAGGKYSSAQTVTITTSSPGATIYYTTDGSRPNTSSTVYAGAVFVSSSETIKALAGGIGYANSSVTSEMYTINAPLEAPQFSPAGGTYTTAQNVTLSSVASAKIYYTTDGSAPSAKSRSYSGPISITATTTIRAIAMTNNHSASAESDATYTIASASASFSVSLTPSSLTVPAGTSETATVLITPRSGFAAPVNLSCSGLPAGASCTFSPSTLNPEGQPTSARLIVTTASQDAADTNNNSRRSLPVAGMALGLCWLGRKRRAKLRGIALTAAASMVFTTFIGCGAATSNLLQAQGATSIVNISAAHDTVQQTTTFSLTVF